MAFFDFLSQPVGGYAQGPMPSGAAGVPQSDVTWQQLLGAATSQGGGSTAGAGFYTVGTCWDARAGLCASTVARPTIAEQVKDLWRV